MKIVLCIVHADFEGPGVLADWVRAKGYTLKICAPYKGEQLPNLEQIQWVIIMGGPQSTVHLDQFPYLRDEIAYVQKAIDQDKNVLGFCLGAQIIGVAMGGKTERAAEKEIGVYPIELIETAKSDPLLYDLPQYLNVIHWHNDMPALTEGAVLLAVSPGCARQIIRYEAKVYGFQCHMEITQAGIKDLIAAVPEDLAPSTYTQTKDALLQNDYGAIHDTMFKILDRFDGLK